MPKPPEGPEIFTTSSTETLVVVPDFPVWIIMLFWLGAAVLALVLLKRERSWATALLCLACWCFALRIVPLVLSFVFPFSQEVMRFCAALLAPLYFADTLGAALIAGHVALRLRGVR